MRLIENWRQFYKMWSVWMFTLISVSPEAYNAIAAMGWLDQVPEGMVWTVRGLAAMGIFSRLIKQGARNVDH